LHALGTLDDARQRLIPYTGSLKGFWKVRVGDHRLICQIIERLGQTVLIIHVAHRSIVYGPRSVRAAKERSE
jgi:mRNA interferase RelE/StbE